MKTDSYLQAISHVGIGDRAGPGRSYLFVGELRQVPATGLL
jgi:hypothetical protein